jgi:Membrane protein implicated in regulation of membrane protease activity
MVNILILWAYYIVSIVTLVALLDDLLLFVAPAVVAFLLYFFDVIPLWAAAAVAAPFLGLAVYVGVKAFKEAPRGFQYIGGRGVAVEDLKPEGLVKVEGVYWRAVCDGCEVTAGGCVELIDVRGGRAYVKPC